MNDIFIFDIDGVITHPHLKKPNELILGFIASELHKKKPLAIATGRSVSWIMRKIIPILQEKAKDNKELDNLFISGEKGGVWIEFSEGVARPYIDNNIHFPKEVAKKIYQFVQGKKGIFFDKDKYTMVSVEINGGEDKEEVEAQKKVLHEVNEWINKNIVPQYPHIVIEPSEISIDIMVKGIDKRVSAKKFLEYLEKKQIAADSFVMFGDSPSDALVPETLKQFGKKVTFMYVGNTPLPQKYNFPVIESTSRKYDEAVVELLQNYSQLKKQESTATI